MQCGRAINSGTSPRMPKPPHAFYAVAYDIADDRRRRRVFAVLKAYGWSVQESVFECRLIPKQFAELRRLCGREIDDEEDSVLFYPLCELCLPRVCSLGVRKATESPSWLVLESGDDRP